MEILLTWMLYGTWLQHLVSYLQLKGADFQTHAVSYFESFFLSLYTRKVSAWGVSWVEM